MNASVDQPTPGTRGSGGLGGRRTELLVIAALVAWALSLRGLYLAEIAAMPDFDQPRVDAEYHDYWAMGLATGKWAKPQHHEKPDIELRPFFRPPGYPYLLAAVYGLFGHDYLIARIAQMLLGAVSCVVGYLLARRVFGAVPAAIGAFLMGGYWALIYFEGELQPPVLLVFLDLCVLLALVRLADRPSLWLAGATGLLIGASALVRPNILLFVPAALMFCHVALRALRPRRRVAIAGLVLSGTLAAVAPATIRNYVVSGEWVLVSSNGGINLYIGNNADSNGYAVTFVEFGSCFDHGRMVRQVEDRLGHEVSDAEASGYWTRQAWAYIKANPGRCLRLAFKKAVLFWDAREIFSNKVLSHARNHSRVLGALPGNFASTAALGLVGLIAAWSASGGGAGGPSRRGVGLIVAFILIYFVSFLPFFVNARYRVPVIALLLLSAGYAVYQTIAWLRARRYLPAGACVAGALIVYVLAGLKSYDLALDPAKWYYDLGRAHAAKQQYERAIPEFKNALSENRAYLMAHYDLGLVYAELGRLNDAGYHLAEAVRIKPDYAGAHNNLGVVHRRLGRLMAAERSFRTAIAINPDYAEAHNNLGTVLADRDRPDEAIRAFRQAIRLRPDYAAAKASLRATLESLGR